MTRVRTIASRRIQDVSSLRSFERDTRGDRRALVQYEVPFTFLRGGELTIVSAPNLTKRDGFEGNIFRCLRFTSDVLFILGTSSPLASGRLSLTIEVERRTPRLPVRFLLDGVSQVPSDRSTVSLLSRARSHIRACFPGTGIFTFSTCCRDRDRLGSLTIFVESVVSKQSQGRRHATGILCCIGGSVGFLLRGHIRVRGDLVSAVG